ncbi:probable serine/threonine-protein kinase PBL18 isoform X2 [Rutidosis leptorrhynchoides]|uniref:probable serine/threonine-protein kinase PBL18 isoform X2 n=1 Tax=Rutidosis leptorrhynchoides TaxID=125765 RepID=UPI003A9A224C
MASTSSASVQLSLQCREFDFPEILLATDNFNKSLVIGSGGFGKVYKGNIISNGSNDAIVAIKCLDSMSSQGATEFWAEIEMLSNLRHCHIVSLIGYCNHGENMILIYEYMPNGSLEDHLHKLGTPLSWLQRLNICIGAGRGLHYLHTGTGIEFGVIHRDVKSSNILLNETWAAKISDFGLSKIGPTNQPSTYVNTHVKGTFGYLDPNYFTTGRLTRKSDVYAFGVVLFEVLCRKRAVDRHLDEDQLGLAIWAQDKINEGNLRSIVDSDIRDQISQKSLKDFVRISKRCLHNHPKQRPTMAEVIVCLESILTLQEKVNSSQKPGFRTIFGKMSNMLPFPSTQENSANNDQMIPSNSNGKTAIASRRFLDCSKVPSDFKIPNPGLKVYTFADLKKATSNFSHDLLLGEGAFGKVFLGWVNQKTFAPSSCGVGIPVAVKRRSALSSQGHAEWFAEVRILGRLAHSNIISLLGYCSDDHECLLVYEYMQNCSFDRFLHPRLNATPLSWGTRLAILMGVARGLAYLHSSKEQIIYNNVKSSSILLNQEFDAKLGDFKLARFGPDLTQTHVTTRVVGTGSFIAPEYIRTGHLSVKSDIYSFGALLLETITGKKAVDIMRDYEPQDLTHWTSLILQKRRRLKEKVDPCMLNYPEEGVFECFTLALRCLAYKPKDRPSSEEVLLSLERICATL